MKKNKDIGYFELFLAFAKIGFMAFGGGYVMLPLLQKELVEKKHWVTENEVVDYFAISQCLPGIIAGNVAGFIGKKLKNTWGAVCSVLGVVFPSFVIITIIAALFSEYSHLQIVEDAFVAIRAAVCVLILSAIIKLWKNAVVSIVTLLIFIGVSLASLMFDLNPIIYVIIAGIIGIISFRFFDKEVNNKEQSKNKLPSENQEDGGGK